MNPNRIALSGLARFSCAPVAEDFCVAPAGMQFRPVAGSVKGSAEKTAPGASSRIAGKSILMELHGCCVETSKLVDGHGRDVESFAEESLRQSQDELRQLSVQLLDIQENERRRIAADLHDGIGQSMSLIKMSMESVAHLINSGAHQEAVESLQQMIHKVKDTMNELRSITTDLRPSMLDDLGIIPTLSWFFREYEMACRDKQIERNIHVAEDDVPDSLKTPIFRILQEAMNNIVKHANAGRIKVGLMKSGGILHFSIEDNGDGFDLASMSIRHGSGQGMGLLTMKERARSSSGIFEMRSIPGRGTRIRISWLPLDEAPERRSDVFEVVYPMPIDDRQAVAL